MAVCVRVKTERLLHEERVPSLRIVATHDPLLATASVRARVSPRCHVEISDIQLSQDTVTRLSLKLGDTHQI